METIYKGRRGDYIIQEDLDDYLIVRYVRGEWKGKVLQIRKETHEKMQVNQLSEDMKIPYTLDAWYELYPKLYNKERMIYSDQQDLLNSLNRNFPNQANAVKRYLHSPGIAYDATPVSSPKLRSTKDEKTGRYIRDWLPGDRGKISDGSFQVIRKTPKQGYLIRYTSGKWDGRLAFIPEVSTDKPIEEYALELTPAEINSLELAFYRSYPEQYDSILTDDMTKKELVILFQQLHPEIFESELKRVSEFKRSDDKDAPPPSSVSFF